MSHVLIVSKTHLQHAACVGGLELETNRSIRLMSPGNHNYQPTDTPFDVGQVWDLDFYDHQVIAPPHYEDVIVTNRQFLYNIENVAAFLEEQQLIHWQGHVNNLFDGLLQWTNSGSGYIPQLGPFPNKSVGFWRTNANLMMTQFEGGKVRYRYPNGTNYRNISFVGFQNQLEIIPANTIIRVSLSRIFPRTPAEMPNVAPGFYLQLSGWYLNENVNNQNFELLDPADDVADDLPF